MNCQKYINHAQKYYKIVRMKTYKQTEMHSPYKYTIFSNHIINIM